MWSASKQRQFDELRRQELERILTPAEQQRLDELLHELDAEEWAALRPAIEHCDRESERLRSDLARIHAQNEALVAIAARYAALRVRARHALAELVTEQEVLRAEYERVVGS
jgi:hypothetical protein